MPDVAAKIGFLFAACLLLSSSPGWATMDNLKSFKQAYPQVKSVSCKSCHQNPVGRKDDLNPYARDLVKKTAPGKAGKLTVENYRAVEGNDSDGDGFTNLEEIQAGTAPGDPASCPKKGAREESLSAEAVAVLRSYLGRLEDSAWAAPAEQAEPVEQADTIGSESCAACHSKEMSQFQQSTHARVSVAGGGLKAQGCEMCHGPGSLHAAAGGGRGVGGIIDLRKDPSPCFSCHMDKRAEFRLSFHHPVMEGKMSCSDCHSAHGQEVRPWSSTTMADVNEACFKCHKEQRGPFVWEHEALREGCVTCHKVHGSLHDKMLVARDNNLCLRCHTQVNFPTIGKQSHGGRLPQGTCFSAGCHTAVHGSNFDDHLRY